MRRLLRLADGMIVNEDELASSLGGLHHHFDTRSDRGVGERHVACVNVAVHDATREIDSPVEVLDFDVAVGVELLPFCDLLRQLDAHDRAGVQRLIGHVGLFGGGQGTSPQNASSQDGS